jgi:hypothetical protein
VKDRSSAFAVGDLETELFGQKIPFHLESSDLAIQLVDLSFCLFSGFLILVKDIRGTFKKGPFPVDLVK